MLKALPEKAYQYFKQKVRSATDKPKDEQDARKASFLALRNFVMSNKPNVGTDKNNTQIGDGRPKRRHGGWRTCSALSAEKVLTLLKRAATPMPRLDHASMGPPSTKSSTTSTRS
jgi:hypothetical protein